MSEVKVNKISPRSGTTVTLGDSGDTFTLASGVSLTGVNATFSGDLTVDTDTLYVDSSNNRVGVGTTSPSVTFDAEADGATVAHFNRATDDGNILEIQKDGTTVGSIGVASGQTALTIGNADTGLSFQGNQNDAIFPYNVSTNALRDNAISLGYSSSRFKDLYLSGSAYLGGTTSANALDDYETGTWTPVYSSAGGLPSSVTYDRQNGYYYKIGGVVHVWWTLRTDAINASGMSGDLHVSGLPFTVGATVNDAVLAGGDAIVDNFLVDTAFTKTGALDNTSTIVFFVEGTHAGTNATSVLKNATNANSMYGHMTYFVDF